MTKIRYLAEYDAARCSLCGLCVRRCHFGAFHHNGSKVRFKGKEKETVSFDPDECWGCGLCANTCPTDAIVMVHIDGERQASALLRSPEDRFGQLRTDSNL
jgi:ferredoxin